MVWIEFLLMHSGASTKFLDYRVYVRYDMQAEDETSHMIPLAVRSTSTGVPGTYG